MPPPVEAQWSIESPDTAGTVGLYTSVVLDDAGNPVVSYQDGDLRALKVMHCNDPNCAGGDESIETVDNSGLVGWNTSIVLDDGGNPIISYHDASLGALKVAHCDDPNCAGLGETIAIVDTIGTVGRYSSLVLDADGNPVVSYRDGSLGALKLAHCGDPACLIVASTTIETVDGTTANVGTHTSLVLDSLGNPVISYRDLDDLALALAHCNDPACSGGGDTVWFVDTAGDVGLHSSLALDSSGNPLVAYFDAAMGLKIARCGDPNCGVPPLIEIFVADADGGEYASVAIGPESSLAVAYRDGANGDLKLLRCDELSCTDGIGIEVVDSAGSVGEWASLVLDPDHAVISYFDATNGDLKVARE